MHAYSTDLKERLARAVAEGQPMREAARRFGVAVTTVKRAVAQQREIGLLRAMCASDWRVAHLATASCANGREAWRKIAWLRHTEARVAGWQRSLHEE